MRRQVDPIQPTDESARQLAKELLDNARYGALGVLELDTGEPLVSRVAVGRSHEGFPITLVSELSHHTRALRVNPSASLLVGEPGEKGDPLSYPRLSVMAHARFIEHADPDYTRMANRYLKDHPKAKLYIGFADFLFVIFEARKGFLNAGFGKAFVVTAADMGLQEPQCGQA